MSKENLLNEMKSYSGIQLNESDTSSDKTLRAEARLADSFASIISSIKSIKFECGRRPFNRYNQENLSDSEKREMEKKPDTQKLYLLAKMKLKLVDEAIDEYLGSGKKEVEREEEDED